MHISTWNFHFVFRCIWILKLAEHLFYILFDFDLFIFRFTFFFVLFRLFDLSFWCQLCCTRTCTYTIATKLTLTITITTINTYIIILYYTPCTSRSISKSRSTSISRISLKMKSQQLKNIKLMLNRQHNVTRSRHQSEHKMLPNQNEIEQAWDRARARASASASAIVDATK
jgi:hypothetical protein